MMYWPGDLVGETKNELRKKRKRKSKIQFETKTIFKLISEQLPTATLRRITWYYSYPMETFFYVFRSKPCVSPWSDDC